MATQIGIGLSKNADSNLAAQEALKGAMADAQCTDPDLVMIFATSKHNFIELQAAVAAQCGSTVKIVGGSAVGIITNDQLSYGGYEVGLAVFKSAEIQFELLHSQGLGSGQEYEVGADLAKKLKSLAHSKTPSKGTFLFYDSVRSDKKTLLNMATPLLAGMESVLQGQWPPIAGVGMIGDMQLNPTFQILNQEVAQQLAMAVSFSGNCRLDTMILHGCRPASDYHTITKTDGPVVLEINGERAVDVIGKLLGPNSHDWYLHPFFVTLGLNMGDKYGEFKEEDYANRLCMAVDQERGGLIMFEPDLKAGDQVQLMRKNINYDYIVPQVDAFFEKLKDRKPVFAFYIDCAGRAAAYCGADQEEAAEVQKAIGKKVPLLGIYSGVEIAKLGSRPRALDWTGVLCLLSQ